MSEAWQEEGSVPKGVPVTIPSNAPSPQPKGGYDSKNQPAAAEDVGFDVPKMESSVGFDFVPLLTALQAGEFREADQLTRDGLITIAGEQAQKRGFVYFSEVPKLPKEDLATIERLWNTYSKGKFGYSVQAKAFNSKRVARKLPDLYDRIGWQRKDIDGNGDEKSKKLLLWLPDAKQDEFIYDLEKAPIGHLPLTSTLRGTQLLLNLLDSDVWNNDEFEAE